MPYGRRYSSRRGFYGQSRFKRRRFTRKAGKRYRGRAYKPSVAKRLVRGSLRAAKNVYQKADVCKDLGVMFPECMLVKFTYILGTKIFSVAGATPYYDAIITLFPYRPCASIGAAPWNSVIGGDTLTNDAVGWSRLVGASSPSLYKRCCVASVKYQVLIHPKAMLTSGGNPLTAFYTIQDWRHSQHFYSANSARETAPTTCDAFSLSQAQPDVKTQSKLSPGTAICSNANPAANLVFPPASACTWKGTFWPHKELGIPYTDYVGADGSFGQATTNPANLCTMQVFGVRGDPAILTGSDRVDEVRVKLVFNCILKDRNVSIQR
jgi:hypothetical protein